MSTGTGNLPNPNNSVSPFDIGTSEWANNVKANIDSLADGTGVGDKSVTLPKINGGTTAGVLTTDASGNVSANGNYSTSEVSTNTTWVDGKTIYKKTFNLGSLPNNTSKDVAHNITGLDQLIELTGVATFSSGLRLPVPFVSTISTASQIQITVSATTINILTGVDRSTGTAYVTLLYTKE